MQKSTPLHSTITFSIETIPSELINILRSLPRILKPTKTNHLFILEQWRFFHTIFNNTKRNTGCWVTSEYEGFVSTFSMRNLFRGSEILWRAFVSLGLLYGNFFLSSSLFSALYWVCFFLLFLYLSFILILLCLFSFYIFFL